MARWVSRPYVAPIEAPQLLQASWFPSVLLTGVAGSVRAVQPVSSRPSAPRHVCPAATEARRRIRRWTGVPGRLVSASQTPHALGALYLLSLGMHAHMHCTHSDAEPVGSCACTESCTYMQGHALSGSLTGVSVVRAAALRSCAVAWSVSACLHGSLCLLFAHACTVLLVAAHLSDMPFICRR